MIFNNDMFTRNLAPPGHILINADYKTWQTIVLHGLLVLHLEGAPAAFHHVASDDVALIYGGKSDLRDVFWAREYDVEIGAGWTTRGIPMENLWDYTREHLQLYGIGFNDDKDDSDSFLELRSAVVEYVYYLTRSGYLMNLNTRENDDSEIVVKLTPAFKGQFTML